MEDALFVKSTLNDCRLNHQVILHKYAYVVMSALILPFGSLLLC